VEDDLELKASGLYSIPCECGKVYIGETGRLIEIQPTVLTGQVALGHRILLNNISALAKKSRRRGRLIREATEIELHPNA
jgi:hypothetical protein